MLVYDITNEKSFDNIKNWIRNIEEVNVTNVNSLICMFFFWCVNCKIVCTNQILYIGGGDIFGLQLFGGYQWRAVN